MCLLVGKVEEIIGHSDVVLLSSDSSSKNLGRIDNLRRGSELRLVSRLSGGNLSARHMRNSVRNRAAASLSRLARAVLVIRVQALVLLLDVVCHLLVVGANVRMLHVPASSKNLGNLVVGDTRALSLNDLVTLLAVEDVSVGRSWDTRAWSLGLRALEEKRIDSATSIQEHSAIGNQVASNSKIPATLLDVMSVENGLSELNHEEVGESSSGALIHLPIEFDGYFNKLESLFLLRHETLEDAVDVLASPRSLVNTGVGRRRAHQHEGAHSEDCFDLSWSCWRSESWNKSSSDEVGR